MHPDRRVPAPAAPVTLAQVELDVGQRGADAVAGLGRATDRVANVIAVQPRVVPQGLDTLAEGSVVAAAGLAGPGGVVEDRQQTGTGRGDGGALIGQFGGAMTRSLGDLAGGDLGRAEAVEAPGGDVGHRADHVTSDVADGPAGAAAGRVEFGGCQRPDELLEGLQFVDEAVADIGSRECHAGAPIRFASSLEDTCGLHACLHWRR